MSAAQPMAITPDGDLKPVAEFTARTSGKTAPRVAEAARQHAREKGHATRFLVLTVTEYRPEATP